MSPAVWICSRLRSLRLHALRLVLHRAEGIVIYGLILLMRRHPATLNAPPTNAGGGRSAARRHITSGEHERCDRKYRDYAAPNERFDPADVRSTQPYPRVLSAIRLTITAHLSNSMRTPSAPIVSDSPRRTPTSRK